MSFFIFFSLPSQNSIVLKIKVVSVWLYVEKKPQLNGTLPDSGLRKWMRCGTIKNYELSLSILKDVTFRGDFWVERHLAWTLIKLLAQSNHRENHNWSQCPIQPQTCSAIRLARTSILYLTMYIDVYMFYQYGVFGSWVQLFCCALASASVKVDRICWLELRFWPLS